MMTTTLAAVLALSTCTSLAAAELVGVVVPVSSLEASAAWYNKHLGFTEYHRGVDTIDMRNKASFLLLTKCQSGCESRRVALYFRADLSDKETSGLIDAGATFSGQRVMTGDLDGNGVFILDAKVLEK